MAWHENEYLLQSKKCFCRQNRKKGSHNCFFFIITIFSVWCKSFLAWRIYLADLRIAVDLIEISTNHSYILIWKTVVYQFINGLLLLGLFVWLRKMTAISNSCFVECLILMWSPGHSDLQWKQVIYAFIRGFKLFVFMNKNKMIQSIRICL